MNAEFSKKYNKKLALRVLRSFIIIIIVIVLSLGYLFQKNLKNIYKTELVKRGEALCNNLAFNSKYEVFIRDEETLDSLLEGILLEEDTLFAYIEDDDKQDLIVFKSKKSEGDKLFENIKSHGLLVNESGSEFVQLDNGETILHLSRPVFLEPEEEENNGDETVLYITPEKELVPLNKARRLGYAHIGMSLERLNEDLAASEKFILGLSLIFIAVFSVITIFFSRSIVNPIIALVNATKKVAQGDLDYRAEVNSRDEIGLLTDSFNKMTEDLQKFQEQILELNRGLEKRIKERTYELDQSNQQLVRRNDELQKMARELEQSNIKIKEADRLKSEFLANMSHELRTPLNSIIGFSALSLKDDDVLNMPNIKDNFEEIHKNGKQLLDIINDILDLSKVEAGRMDFVKKKFDVRDTIEAVAKTMRILVDKKNIEIITKCEENIPLVTADPDRVRQILLNVGSNAVKFTEKGAITISVEKKGNYIQLSTEDTGAGIKEIDIPKVFESFRQIDGSSTRKEGGTGLGMTISRKFVEMMGGTIWIESEYGKGSTVFFTVPVSATVDEEGSSLPSLMDDTEQRISDIAKQVDVDKGHKNTIFIIEDDMSAIKLYEKILRKNGFEVAWETSGQNASARAKELKPFAIFLDINLPDKDGWQILTELKTCEVCQNIPVVMSSILSEQHKGFALGAVEYLVKPIHEDDLLRVLRNIKLSGQKVAVVDDTHSDVLLVTKILERFDYEIHSAFDGLSGLELINEILPDVVLLDIMMPVMDGFQVIDKLKRRKSTRFIPIIVMTAKDLNAEEKEFLHGKIEALIQKSHLNEENLMDVLFDVLKHYNFEGSKG